MAIYITNHHLRSATHKTYCVTFFADVILTTVTADSSVVDNWISEILSIHHYCRGKLIAGLDTEWRPSTRRIHNPVATLQICVGCRYLVYQIIHSDGYISQSLADFLADDDITFVGVGVEVDLNLLSQDYDIENEARAVDLRWLVAEEYGRPDLRNSGLKDLARLVLGKDMVKPRSMTVSDWDNRWLNDKPKP